MGIIVQSLHSSDIVSSFLIDVSKAISSSALNNKYIKSACIIC